MRGDHDDPTTEVEMDRDTVRPRLALSVPLFVFNNAEARTIDAITARIFPADDRSGGGHEAEVVVYIDRALAGYSRHLQNFYRHHLRELDVYCSAHFGGPFVGLSEGVQYEVIEHMDTGDTALGELGPLLLPEPTTRESGRPNAPVTLQIFFNVLWEHTIQGLFCDPAYGGNKNAIGWRAIGFPGAHWSYTTEQRKRGFDATTIPIKTLTDLQQEQPWKSTYGLGDQGEEGNSAAT